MELPLSLLSPPAVGTSNAASTSNAATQPANTIPVVTVKKESKKKHHLTTVTDPLFSELRDINFSLVGKKLNKVARRLDGDYKVSHLTLTCILVSKIGNERRISKRKLSRNCEISWANLVVFKRNIKPFDFVSLTANNNTVFLYNYCSRY